MTPVSIDAATQALVTARQRQVRVPAADAAVADAQAAYAVQYAVADALSWFANGVPQHWKSGGASRDAVLTHAPLPPAGVWASPADARHWPFHERGIEVEIALRLAREVDAPTAAALKPADVSALIDALCVSIEIVDSRFVEGVQAPPLAKLADLQSHGALVLGAWQPWRAHDWSQQHCRVQIGAQAAIEVRGSHALADPAYVLPAWLRHVTRHGRAARAGTVVTTGTWVGILPAQAGDLVHAEFAGIGDASVQL